MHLSRNIDFFLLRSLIPIIDNELPQYNNSMRIKGLVMILKFKDWNLKFKILFAAMTPFILAAIIIIPLTAGSIIDDISSKSKLYTDKLAYGASFAVSMQIDHYINEAIETSEVFSAIAEHGTLNNETVDKILLSTVAQNKNFVGVWSTFDPRNKSLPSKAYVHRSADNKISKGEWSPKVGELIKELELKCQNNKGINIAIDANPQDPLMLVSYPIINNKNDYMGSVGVITSLNTLSNILRKSDDLEPATLTLIRSDGTVLSSSDSEQISMFSKVSHLPNIEVAEHLKLYTETTAEGEYKAYAPIIFEGTSDIWILCASNHLNLSHNNVVWRNMLVVGFTFLLSLFLGASATIVIANSILRKK
jgi:hypothetical protein